MIPFNQPPHTGNEEKYVINAIKSSKISGDGTFSKNCQTWFEKKLPAKTALLTPSCTAALELAALLLDIKPGDEVIMPSYTFVSTANAFALRGATIVFVDIRPDTMNIDEALIESAITDKTRAIVPVHYAGVACNMDAIMSIAQRHNLYVIEDAAQGVMASYKGKALGAIGHLGAFSFHETKNYTSGGEGGLLIINEGKFKDRAEIIREKGTNRSQFFRGMVDKYQWVDLGSSYLPSELQAAYLWGQLEQAQSINKNRLSSWQRYYKGLLALQETGKIDFPFIPEDCIHNAHMFYIKVKNLVERTAILEHLRKKDIMAAFHYVPLHTAKAGSNFSRFHGKDQHTTIESERLIRLPMYYNIRPEHQDKVIEEIKSFFYQRPKIA